MKKKITIIIWAIFMVVLIGGLGFYAFNEYGDYKVRKQTQEETQVIKEIADLRIFKQGLTEEELSAYKDDFEVQQRMFLDYPDGPESYWALVKIARIKQLVEDYDGANQALFLAANLSPESYLAWANLGNLNFRHYKDFVKAEEYYLNAIKPYSAQVIPYYMDLYEIYRYFYKQETTLAEDILKQGIEKYQGVDRVTDLISTLAYYYRETGRIEQAKEYYQKMLEINPDSQTAKKALSELDDF